MTKPLFPLFLRLEGKRCLVVGGGAIAWPKARKLHATGGAVTMVAPKFAPAPGDVDASAIRQIERRFEPEDLEGQALVIAATDDREVQEAVRAEAARRGIWCNVVDVPELCDFTFGAELQRGALQIAISTEGQFPLLAQRLRDRLEARFATSASDGLALLGAARAAYQAESELPYAEKRAVLARLLDEETVNALEAGDLETLRRRIESWRESEGVCRSSR